VSSSGYHVVRHVGEAEAARSPRAGVVVVAETVHGLLPCKVLPLTLYLCLGGFLVHLQSMQAVCHLLKVGHMTTGTLVRRHEPERLLSNIVVVDMVAHARWGIVVNVIRVIL